MTQENKNLKLDQRQIRIDRMRYTKDSLPSLLVILAIVFDALYFISIYQTDATTNVIADPYLYTSWVIGASIVYNLVFLLVAFLASEGVKNRQHGFTIPLIVIGILQFGRIFYLPAKALSQTLSVGETTVRVMEMGQYFLVVGLLIASGVCCIVAAVISEIHNRTLARYMQTLEAESL